MSASVAQLDGSLGSVGLDYHVRSIALGPVRDAYVLHAFRNRKVEGPRALWLMIKASGSREVWMNDGCLLQVCVIGDYTRTLIRGIVGDARPLGDI